MERARGQSFHVEFPAAYCGLRHCNSALGRFVAHAHRFVEGAGCFLVFADIPHVLWQCHRDFPHANGHVANVFAAAAFLGGKLDTGTIHSRAHSLEQASPVALHFPESGTELSGGLALRP
jgi:hypothetical protein